MIKHSITLILTFCLLTALTGQSTAETHNSPPPATTLISPHSIITTNYPTFIWQSVPEADWYYLWLRDSEANVTKHWYQSSAICESAACSVTLDLPLEAGKWWVRTWNQQGSGPWSIPLTFSSEGSLPNTATLLSPHGDNVGTNPKYIWNAVSNASWYYHWVNDSSGNPIRSWHRASDLGCGSGIDTCEITPAVDLAVGDAKWWIRTWNQFGIGAWSNAMAFSVKDSPDSSPTLLFSSGFEEGVYLDSTIDPLAEDYQFIRGTDENTGFSWPIDILGSSGSGLHYIDDDNKQAIFSEIQTVTGHNNTPTKALYSVQNYMHGDATQCPYEILDITEGTKDLYIKYWIKLDGSSLEQADKWRTFFEWKTEDYGSGDGFRLITFIYTDEQGDPYWHFQGDADPQHPVWEIDNKTIPVPKDEWFLTEFYWHWSEGEDGRALWKINGEVVGDHYGPTTRHSKPIDFIMLTQIYGNANPKHQWIDDLEIWDGIPR